MADPGQVNITYPNNEYWAQLLDPPTHILKHCKPGLEGQSNY